MLYITDLKQIGNVPKKETEEDRLVLFCKAKDSMKMSEAEALFACRMPCTFTYTESKEEMLMELGALLEKEESVTLLIPGITIPARFADRVKIVKQTAKKSGRKPAKKSAPKRTPAKTIKVTEAQKEKPDVLAEPVDMKEAMNEPVAEMDAAPETESFTEEKKEHVFRTSTEQPQEEKHLSRREKFELEKQKRLAAEAEGKRYTF